MGQEANVSSKVEFSTTSKILWVLNLLAFLWLVSFTFSFDSAIFLSVACLVLFFGIFFLKDKKNSIRIFVGVLYGFVLLGLGAFFFILILISIAMGGGNSSFLEYLPIAIAAIFFIFSYLYFLLSDEIEEVFNQAKQEQTTKFKNGVSVK